MEEYGLILQCILMMIFLKNLMELILIQIILGVHFFYDEKQTEYLTFAMIFF
jgi:hypothetical protein